MLLCGASKGFMKAFKGFIRLFEAPQSSAEIRQKLIISVCLGSGREGLT